MRLLGTLLPVLQGRLAAQLTDELPRQYRVGPGHLLGSSWGGQGKREFSGLRRTDLVRQASSFGAGAKTGAIIIFDDAGHVVSS